MHSESSKNSYDQEVYYAGSSVPVKDLPSWIIKGDFSQINSDLVITYSKKKVILTENKSALDNLINIVKLTAIK